MLSKRGFGFLIVCSGQENPGKIYFGKYLESWFLPQTSQVTALRAISSEGTFYGQLGKSRNDAKGRKYLIFHISCLSHSWLADLLIVSHFSGILIEAPQIPFIDRNTAWTMAQEESDLKNVETYLNFCLIHTI